MSTTSEQIVEALRASTKEVERLRGENRRLLAASREPLAIVGLSCRYPGGADSPERLWELLRDGRSAISEPPTDREWSPLAQHDFDLSENVLNQERRGGFLHDAPDFDAEFFKISPREALAMDPHQRLLLEASWEALEDAGIDPTTLRGSRTGVFAGAMHQDYGPRLREDDPSLSSADGEQTGYFITGGAASVVSGRVAYSLGLEGPTISVDTACSSSLVALHLACQALRADECSLALAGGVTVLSTPTMFGEFARQRALAPDGQCKPFADAADGISISEGVGVLLLERLSDARRLGHRVLAVVRGSAVNQDGASNGLTAPNGPSQQRVIRQALVNAGLSAGEVDVVEGHGTGTTLGDPIEAQALLATYGRDRGDRRPLWLGSVKSNLGHTQAAAGVAGVIKMVLALGHGVLPRTLHVDAPSSRVDWSGGSVSLLAEAQPWVRNGEPRRAGVSSFGISGTNAHVILEEAPPETAQQRRSDSRGERVAGAFAGAVLPWVLSGRDEGALRGQAERLRAHLDGLSAPDLTAVGRALATRRAAFEKRAVVIGSDHGELLDGLDALAKGQSSAGHLRGTANCAGAIAFLFPGQGAQWVGMAVDLLEGSPVFAESLQACEEALSPHVRWSLTDVLRDRDGAQLDRVDVVQPVLFAVMVSLAALWRACGVNPDLVVGHSQGEIAAACVAGGLSLEDGALVVASRSKALAALAGKGGMVSLACSGEELESLLERSGEEISVAAVNGPGAVVVSGEPGALSKLLAQCESENVRARKIPVDYAAHSAQVETIEAELVEACASISPRSAKTPFYSAVTAGMLDTAELDARYWYRNLREPVQFERTTEAIFERGARRFLEVSPHPVLTVAVQETVERLCAGESRRAASPRQDLAPGSSEGEAVVVSGTLRRDQGGPRRFLASLGELWARGTEIDWGAVLGGGDFADVSLPTYAFQRKRYWLNAGPSSGDAASIGLVADGHPLLGATAPLAGDRGCLFTGRLSLETHRWLGDHVVMGAVLVPGTAFLELALHAAGRIGCELVSELLIEAPLVLEEGEAIQLQLSVSEMEESGSRSLHVYSRPESRAGDTPLATAEWTRHASGILVTDGEPSTGAGPLGEEIAGTAGTWPPHDAEPVSLEGLYDRLAEAGLDYGPAFQNLKAAWRRGDQLFAEVALPVDRQGGGAAFIADPTLLDAALHVLGSAVAGEQDDGDLRLPFAWNGVRVHAPGASSLRVALVPNGESSVSLLAVDESSAPVISVESLVARKVSPEQLHGHRAGRLSDVLHRVQWAALATDGESVDTVGWAVIDPDTNGALALEGLDAQADRPAVFTDLAALREAIGEGAPARVVLANCSTNRTPAATMPAEDPSRARAAGEEEQADAPLIGARQTMAVRDGAHRALALVQEWLADERLAESLLVLVTQGSVAVAAGEDIPGLLDAPLWGLARSLQLESPGRVALIDVDGEQGCWSALRAAVELIGAGESQLAVRHGTVYAPRLVREPVGALEPPRGESHWRLALGPANTFEDLRLVAAPELAAPLERGQVRVAMRGAGVNFRDVVAALGVVSLRGEWDAIGSEGAGVVLEVGPGVEDLEVGDRVMGLFTGAFGPQAVTDRLLLVQMPREWSFAQAAAVPGAFLTAYYGLVELAKVKPGERVLVHAAAGGVGMAAVQLARWLGAEVLATASQGKWGALLRIGLSESQIASSRDLEFKDRFLTSTKGGGVDVILNSLAGEFVEASLELVCNGGRFLEMGKTDIRDPQEVAERHPGVLYRAFDLIEAGPERIQAMLVSLLELFEQGAIELPPIRAWDVRRAAEAFRFMAQARHVGKIVLSIPSRHVGEGGTILITGGTGGLGALVAMHLARQHGARDLLLLSRRGREAPGAIELEQALREQGAEVTIAACDVSDRAQLERLLARIPSERPLRAVVHTAGVLDDCLIGSLTPERLDSVMAPKVDAAWHLHELTRDLDLDAFVLFSSLAGTLGGPAQGNYAAANTFLDALAARRRAHGLPGVSMAWGWWEQATGLTGHLSETDLARLRRSGIAAMSSEEGLRLFDRALTDVDALTVPVRLDEAALRTQARTDALPAMLRSLVRASSRRSGLRGEGQLAERLRDAPAPKRREIVLQLVRSEAAAVLGHSSPEAIGSQRVFKELGFDSLLAVELRNRLNALTGLRLAATLVFDYPTPALLADRMLEEIGGVQTRPSRPATVAPVREDPVAIVGMACRYPGDAHSPQGLWELLARGGDAISEFPSDREWDVERLYDSESLQPGTTYIREGGFVYDAPDFDAELFKISPREALAMDPQQRLLLEASWEAFEDGGIAPDSLRGSRTGVFAGTTSQDYSTRANLSPDSFDGFLVTGNSASVLSGRVAYSLGLEGPAVTLDTACSSSLVALHLACQALRADECSLALAGGVAVMATPVAFLEFARQRGLARDGRCKSFADAADGTNWGEGVGVLLLERLSDARRLGHRVLAVVRGSAVNQDGASNGLTAPNGPSQQRVIRQALVNAGLSAGEVDVVEGHGTGTTLGDPIEAQALLATYGRDRGDRRPLWLGSVKSNLGHTQAAAGVAGVIKMVLALGHGVLPRTLHVDAPSSRVDWSGGSVSLLAEAQPWVRNGEPRRAGVSSFGVSGTNAHVILEEAPPETAQQIGSESQPPETQLEQSSVLAAVDGNVLGGDLVPWIVSASGERGLRGQAARLRELLAKDDSPEIGDVGFSLATTRAMLDRRAVAFGRNGVELAGALDSLLCGEPAANLIEARVAGDGGTVFLFPGQGSQWEGMAVELLDRSPVFAQRISECETALSAFVEWSLEDVLRGAPGAPGLERLEVVQPVLFSTMVALAALWRACGVDPVAVVGHSQGEIAAACVAGALSLDDATRVVALRSKLLTSLNGQGSMVSVAASREWVSERLQRWSGRLVVAGVNGPHSVGVAGDREGLEELLAECEGEGVRAREVPGATVATHAPLVEVLREDLLQALAGIAPQAGELSFYSTVTGGPLDGTELGAEYWYRNMREPVRFEQTVRGLMGGGHHTFVEVSAHPVLAVGVQETAEDWSAARGGVSVDVGVIGSLRRDQGGPERFVRSLGEAWARGVSVDWGGVFEGSGARKVALPTYPFQRERYWLGGSAETQAASQANSAPLNETPEQRFWESVESESADDLARVLELPEEVESSSLKSLLPALAGWRRRRRAESAVDGWRYRVGWTRVSDSPPTLSGLWLLLVPDGSLDDDWVLAVIAALELHGAQVLAIELDAEHDLVRERLGKRIAEAIEADPEDGAPHDDGAPDGWELPASDWVLPADGVESLSGRGDLGARVTVAGVLSLLALDEEPHPDYNAVPRGLSATVALTQALDDVGVDGRLWLLTRGAVAAGSDDRLNNPSQSMSWGLGRTLSLEQPHRWGGLVDLPETLDEQLLRRLCGVLASVGGEDQLAIRAGGTLGRRMERANPGEGETDAHWRPRGTVLLTGGTGGLGSHVARWLASSGAEHLLLLSRQGSLAPGADELKSQLEVFGTRVSLVECDVADRARLSEVIEAVPAEHPLEAVFHIAGVGGIVALGDLTAEQAQSTLAGKALGARNLHELTQGIDLSAFVLFSSMAATTGSAGQGDYAAANAFLDALAEHRHACGLVATSVAWGGWAGQGKAALVADRFRRRGLLEMDPELAIRALGQAIDRGEACVTVADIDWSLYAPTYASARPRPLIAELPEARTALAGTIEAAGEDDDGVGELAASLAGMSERERQRAVLDLVRAHAAAVLGHSSPDEVDLLRPFRELGFDSLMGVELRNRLQAATGISLPTTLVFDQPSCVLLADSLVEMVGADGSPSGSSLETELATLEVALASLGDEGERSRVSARLRALLDGLSGNGGSRATDGVARSLDSASDEEIFGFIEKELGSP